MRHGFDADIPRLRIDIVRICSAAAETGRFIDLVGERRSRKNLSQQRVGIESDRREQVIEFFRREGLQRPVVLSPE